MRTRDLPEVNQNGQNSVSLQQWLKLLRHLVYNSSSGKAVVAQTEILPTLHRCWKVLTSVPASLNEALLFISVLVSDSFDARHVVASSGEPSLLLVLLTAFLRCGL